MAITSSQSKTARLWMLYIKVFPSVGTNDSDRVHTVESFGLLSL